MNDNIDLATAWKNRNSYRIAGNDCREDETFYSIDQRPMYPCFTD